MYREELHCLTALASDVMMLVETYYNLVQLCFSKIFKGMANGIDTEEEIYRITYYVKGRMLVSFIFK
ncbi:hypothetical protein HanPI659440_Chr14g0557761 [Helianthus annuus]|nr:hypothetical protein HanPI659440_Chr14g0557761 [Helianthus annuus]